jgi:hypothetical protein
LRFRLAARGRTGSRPRVDGCPPTGRRSCSSGTAMRLGMYSDSDGADDDDDV